MIPLHRLKGETLYLNADLIEAVESTPDTVLTLVDGRKVVVAETPEVVLERVTRFRGAILAAADELRRAAPTAPAASSPQPNLVLLKGEEGEA